jgi:hypothetical protein
VPFAPSFVVGGLLFGLVSTLYALAGPAQRWVADAPIHFNRMEEKLRAFQKPLADFKKATEQFEKATELKAGPVVQKVQIERPALTSRLRQHGARHFGCCCGFGPVIPIISIR